MRRAQHSGRRTSAGLRLEVFSPDELDAVHLSTLEVLERTGVFVDDPEARDLLRAAGSHVNTDGVVRIPGHVVEEAVASAPHVLRLHGRDEKDALTLRPGDVTFSAIGQALRIVDPDTRELRPSLLADVRASGLLLDALPVFDALTGMLAAHDAPEATAPLHRAEQLFAACSKHMLLLAGGTANLQAMTAMAAAAAGLSPKDLTARPTLTFVVCPVSPLKLIREVCEVVLEAARTDMPLCVVSMVLAGMTGPVRLAGSVVLHNAEVLATLTLAQLARKGAPVIYGSCSTGADLRYGAGTLGTPECGLMSAALASLSRRYRLPAWSVAGWGDAKTVDAQAGHEYTLSALLVALAGGGFIPGAGMLESGSSFDFAKLVLDAEFAGLIKHTIAGVPVTDETLSLDVIHDVGPFGDFLSHDDTYRHMREQSQPTLIDRRVREEWTQAGATDIAERARLRAREILETHEPTPLPDGAAEEMRAIVADADERAGV